MGDLTRDAFLGGRVILWQPAKGYRAGVDPVLLAAAVPAVAGQTALDLGCGVGAAALCLAARVPGVSVVGLERQPDYAALARHNAEENGAAFEVFEGDLAAPPAALRQMQVDHVLANPPYYDAAARSAAADPGREAALAEETPLAVWLDAGLRRLKPRGTFSLIQRADRLPDLLSACDARLGSLTLRPVVPRDGRNASLVLLQGVKGGRAAFRLLPPLVMHEGARHERDGESYRPEVSAVLRDAAALPR